MFLREVLVLASFVAFTRAFKCTPTYATSFGVEGDYTSVFTEADYTYFLDNTLATPFTHPQSGNFFYPDVSTTNMGIGRWPEQTDGYSAFPTENTTLPFGRSVFVPGSCVLISATNRQFRPVSYSKFTHQVIDDSGVVVNRQTVAWEDDFTGDCALISNDAQYFYCYTMPNPTYDHSFEIRKYQVSNANANLKFVSSIAITVPARMQTCDDTLGPYTLSYMCYGGTFATDEFYHYFAERGHYNNEQAAPADAEYSAYHVFSKTDGTYIGRVNVPDDGFSATALAFDWAVGRYLTFDGNGVRTSEVSYDFYEARSASDSATYSPPSLYYTLAPSPYPVIGSTGECVPVYWQKIETTPDYATVFLDPDYTYTLDGTHVTPFTHTPSGNFFYPEADSVTYGIGRWPEQTGGYPASPAYNTTDRFTRSVYIPGHCTLVSSNRFGFRPVPASSLTRITITPKGKIIDRQTIDFSDDFTGDCALLGSDAEFFYCYTLVDYATNDRLFSVRKYSLTSMHNTFDFESEVFINVPAQMQTCDKSAEYPNGDMCFGGTFAVDGTYFYFAERGHFSTTAAPVNASYSAYHVFDMTDGSWVDRVEITDGSFSATALSVDWANGRYLSFDGMGTRYGGTVYDFADPRSASQTATYLKPSPSFALYTPGAPSGFSMALIGDDLRGIYLSNPSGLFVCGSPLDGVAFQSLCDVLDKVLPIVTATPTADDLSFQHNGDVVAWVSSSDSSVRICGQDDQWADVCAIDGLENLDSLTYNGSNARVFFSESFFVSTSGELSLCGYNMCSIRF